MLRVGLLGRWVVAFTLGELIGFGLIPALGGVVTYYATEGLSAPARPLILYALSVIGGLGEGVVLGRFQLGVLRDVFPELDGRRWVLATGIAASVAWAAGMAAPTLDDLVGLPIAAQIVTWVLAAIVVLPSIGIAQSRVLRDHVERSGRWILANVVGWLGGLPWTFVLPMSVPDDSPAWVFAVAMVVGGVLMGATVGLLTGLWLRAMAPES